MDQPWCVSPSASLTTCKDANISGLVSERFALAATFTPSVSANLSWSGLAAGAEYSLGCFLLKGSPSFRSASLVQGFRVGLTYKDTDSSGSASRMVGSICGPPSPVLNLSSVSGLRFVNTPLPQGEVDRLGQSGVVCTAVSVKRHNADAVQVCLSTTNLASASPICSGSSNSGRLTGVFFGAEPFQTPSIQLGVEDGQIKAKRPYCAGDGSVTSCQGANISTALDSRLAFDLGFELSTPVSFNLPNSELGCFYVTGFIAALLGDSGGWDVGLTFDQLNGGTKAAKMASTIYSEAELPPTAPCAFNTVNQRAPLSEPDSTADLVCTAVRVTPVATSELQVGPYSFDRCSYGYYSCVHPRRYWLSNADTHTRC